VLQTLRPDDPAAGSPASSAWLRVESIPCAAVFLLDTRPNAGEAALFPRGENASRGSACLSKPIGRGGGTELGVGPATRAGRNTPHAAIAVRAGPNESPGQRLRDCLQKIVRGHLHPGDARRDLHLRRGDT